MFVYSFNGNVLSCLVCRTASSHVEYQISNSQKKMHFISIQNYRWLIKINMGGTYIFFLTAYDFVEESGHQNG